MYYKAYGLSIKSDILLPPLIETGAVSDYPDVVVLNSPVSSEGIIGAVSKRAFAQVKKNCVWFDVPNIARFQIEDGRNICYESYGSLDEQTTRLYILGSCFGAILHQRGNLALHANAVKVDGEAVLVAGHSGVGKSTTAAAFYKKGFQVLNDDVAAISQRSTIVGGIPQIKLWEDSLDHLKMSKSGLDRIRFHINKYSLPVDQLGYEQDLPIGAIYILSAEREIDGINFIELEGLGKFNHLKEHTYRENYIEGLGLKSSHMQLCARVANSVPVTKIIRSLENFDALRLAEAILQDFITRKNG